jgi:micrococcal nuclease
MIGWRLCRVTFIVLLTGAMTAPVVFHAQQPQAPAAATRKPTKPQTRPHSVRVAVDPKLVNVDDGDTIEITWPTGDIEEVRLLGIDCPETRHLPHDIPFAQPFGDEARAFALGTFATATKIELLRAATMDPYDRSLAYVFVDGKNYSVLVLEARLAEETISAFGDNGFPKEAAIVTDAAKGAGPLPFEPPYQYRNRMRRVTEWMKGKGIYPSQ